MLPLGIKLVQRAKEAGCLRPDFQPQDIPILLVMLTTIVDAARDVEPDLWQRYIEIVFQGLRAAPTPPEQLAIPALEIDQVDIVMSAWKLPNARR
jgi:hypothetical protein